MPVNENNPIADLIELKLRAVPAPDGSDQMEIRAELRIKPDELELDDIRCIIGFKKVSIYFRLDGMSIVPGSRLGEPFRGEVATERHSTTIETESGHGYGAALGGQIKSDANLLGTGPSASAHTELDLKATKSMHKTRKIERTEDREISNVIARGNNTWDIAENDNSTLDGSYLLDSKILFQSQKNKGSNRQFFEALAMIRHRDLDFRVDCGPMKKFTLNNRRLISLFVAKCIAGKQYAGRIVASSVEVEIE